MIKLGLLKLKVKWFLEDKIRRIIPKHYRCEGCKTTFWVWDRAVIYPSCPACGSRDNIAQGYNAKHNPRWQIRIAYPSGKTETVIVRESRLREMEQFPHRYRIYARMKID